MGIGLPENRTGQVHYLKYPEWEFPEKEGRLCVCKCWKSQLRRPIVHRDQEQSKKQDREIDVKIDRSRHGNIARCRSRGRRDARRPRVIGTNRAIVPKNFFVSFFSNWLWSEVHGLPSKVDPICALLTPGAQLCLRINPSLSSLLTCLSPFICEHRGITRA